MIDLTLPAVLLGGMLIGAGLVGLLFGWLLRDYRDRDR